MNEMNADVLLLFIRMELKIHTINFCTPTYLARLNVMYIYVKKKQKKEIHGGTSTSV